MTSQRFFDRYPEFYATSQTGADADRLHDRYCAIVDANRDILEGSRVLDIASHDGRWSFAVLDAGAEHVTGVEVRRYLVDHALQNMERRGIAAGRYQFICGDALAEMEKLEEGQFDVVLCLGYLYHTVHVPHLIQQIGRLKPKHLILDTQLGIPVGMHEPPEWLDLSAGKYGNFFMRELCSFLSAQPLILLHEDDTRCEGMAVYPGEEDPRVLVGYPTKGALELMLRKAGFAEIRCYDWLNAKLDNWIPSFDYRMGYRITMRCTAEVAPGLEV